MWLTVGPLLSCHSYLKCSLVLQRRLDSTSILQRKSSTPSSAGRGCLAGGACFSKDNEVCTCVLLQHQTLHQLHRS